MTQIITAVYKKGQLRPLQKLNLRENETVQIQILSATSEAEAALAALVSAGLVRPTANVESLPEVSEERQREIADAFGAAGPVSEVIIEERV
jgi:predicted DNA-binding antitoxin AbrB/MazE fold protein